MAGGFLSDAYSLLGPLNTGQLGILDLDLRLKVCLGRIEINGTVEVIVEAVLDGLVAALIVRTGIGHINGGCDFREQSNVVLTAQEIGAVGGVRGQRLHGRLAVGIILRILGDLEGNVGIAGQLLHDIADGLDIIGAGCGADPAAAPVVGLRTLADSVITVDAVAYFFLAALCGRCCQRVAQQGEVDAPSGVEEAENITARTLIGGPLVAPQGRLVVIALVGVILGLLDPSHNVGVYLDGRAVDPRLRNIVGEHTEGVIVAGEHLVALGGGFLGHGIELVPIA